MKNESVHKRILLVTDILLPFLAIALVLTAYFILSPPSSHTRKPAIDLMSGWISEDGSEYSLSDLPEGDLKFTRSIKDIDKYNQSICMRSSDTWLEIEFDGNPAYKYAPEQASVYGKSYGMYFHMVSIPDDANEITLKLHPVYNNRKAIVTSVCIEDAAVFIADIYHKGSFSFLICMIMTGFGIVMLIMGFTSRELNETKALNFFALGSFSMLVSFWSANDTLLLQTYTTHPECVKMLAYLCLILIPYTPVSFMASATHNRDTKFLSTIIAMVGANLLINIILSATGTVDPHNLLFLSHICIAASLIMVICLMLNAIKNKKTSAVFVRMSLIGMTAAVIGVATDLVRYWVNQNNDESNSTFTLLGVLIFIFSEGVYLIRERGRLAVERKRAELMEKMAYTDGLTELANRAASHEKEKEIRKSKKPCVIVQLDINFLKTVNDVYGHAEGDRHIIAAANCIRKGFEGKGACYRTGGDEFVAIADFAEDKVIDEMIGVMLSSAAEYNEKEKPPVPLALAYGYAPYDPEKDDFDDVEILADQRMYEQKKAMKAERTI